MPETLSYTIRRASPRPHLDGNWDSAVWARADTLEVAQFYSARSDHRPKTQARALYSDVGIHVIWRVFDRYVRCVTTGYQGKVYEDACVEFFVQPKPDKGYFNFEVNCGGALLLKYIEDATRTQDGFAKATDVPEEWGSRVEIFHSLPEIVEPEIEGPLEWRVEYLIPFDLLAHYAGKLGTIPGQTWRGNFYKCAENNSHPHWASWAPIGEVLNFHQPERFAPIRFES